MTQRNCPNCGNTLSPALKTSKVVECDACGSTVFLADNAFQAAGEAGVMHPAGGLLTLHQEVRIAQSRFTPIGVLQYSYGRGLWEEFWCRDERDRGVWISVDEGDVVVERALSSRNWPAIVKQPKPGASYLYKDVSFTVTEVERAHCVAFRGELPERPVIGETHDFVNMVDTAGHALSRETWPGGVAWYIGEWVDPFEVTTP